MSASQTVPMLYCRRMEHDIPAAELVKIADKAVEAYRGGDIAVVEQAIGAMFAVRHYGLQPFQLMHSKQTIKKYEALLGIKFESMAPPEGKLAKRSKAWEAWKDMQKIKKGAVAFWQAVNGEFEKGTNVRSSKVL